MLDLLSEILKKSDFKKEDAYGFDKVKVSPMKFEISRYSSPLGNLSSMKGSAMLGMMKMDTIIFIPTKKDMPLLSYDRILAMGNDSLFVELYNTVDGFTDVSNLDKYKDSLKDVPEREMKECWYDNLKMSPNIYKKFKDKGLSKRCDDAVISFIDDYFKLLSISKDRSGENLKAKDYREGLLSNGGASTDVFIKKLGKEKTEELFRKVLFVTE